MGLCKSCHDNRVSAAIDEELIQEQEHTKSVIKLLLLGPAESGKSTILKQLRILHTDGFTPEEYEHQTISVYANVLSAMTTMVAAMKMFEIEFADKDREDDWLLVMEFIKDNGERAVFQQSIAAALKRLWADDGLQKCFIRANDYHLPHSTEYFYRQLDRIGRPDYMVTQDDLLHLRISTTGIVELAFVLKDINFRVYDVGGQRSERKKWIHCFEGVHGIIFIASMSEYNQSLYEDQNTNRMQESVGLFVAVSGSIWFLKTSMLLYLNKIDLFAEKIKILPLTIAFPEYNGANNYAEASEYIKAKYVQQASPNRQKPFYVHFTCATDTSQVQLVLQSTMDSILASNLKMSGLY